MISALHTIALKRLNQRNEGLQCIYCARERYKCNKVCGL